MFIDQILEIDQAKLTPEHRVVLQLLAVFEEHGGTCRKCGSTDIEFGFAEIREAISSSSA